VANSIPEKEGHIHRHDCAESVDDLERKADAVLKASAVLVLERLDMLVRPQTTIVDRRATVLRDKQRLDEVEARPTSKNTAD
jgi:hypothetical protein